MIVRTFDQEKVLEAKHALEMTKLMRRMEERQIELTACRAGEKGFSDELDKCRAARNASSYLLEVNGLKKSLLDCIQESGSHLDLARELRNTISELKDSHLALKSDMLNLEADREYLDKQLEFSLKTGNVCNDKLAGALSRERVLSKLHGKLQDSINELQANATDMKHKVRKPT